MGKEEGLAGSLDCPPISNPQNGLAVSLLSMGNLSACNTDPRSTAGPGMMAAPLVKRQSIVRETEL